MTFVMQGALLKVALAAAAPTAAASGSGGPNPGPRPPTLFGGPAAVHLTHVGRIESDLEPAGSPGLRRVACIGVSNRTTTCFVAR
jgi:hypothetical protein